MLRPDVAHVVNADDSPRDLGPPTESFLNKDILKSILEKVGNVGGADAAKESYFEKGCPILASRFAEKLFASAGMPSGLH